MMPMAFMWRVVIKDFRKILVLFIAYILYLILGAIVFQYFEAPLEQSMRLEVSEMITIFDSKLKMLNHPNITQSDIRELLHKFLVARDMNLVDQFGTTTNRNWNFYNSFFFSITVVTTIGYGHFLPSTASGKIFCLFYALFGIPMTGILLGAIGNLFSRCFRRRVKQIKKKYHNDMNPKIVLCYCETAATFFLPWFIVFLIIPSAIFVLVERWSFLEGFYYSFITLTTIGFGDYVAGNYDGQAWVILYKLMVVVWIIFGLSYLSMVLSFIGRGYQKVEHSEMMHSMGRNISEPFLHKHFHWHDCNHGNKELSLNIKVTEERQRRHSDGGSPSVSTPSDSSYFDIKSHHNHHKSNTSVIPYYP